MKVQVCLVALCSLIFHCSASYGQASNKGDRSAEWEYKQFYNPSDEMLNHYAKDGWEIGAAAGSGGDTSHSYLVILKRSKSHPRFGTQTPEFILSSPLPLFLKPKCKLTMAQAPVIRGLQLGMTSDQLFSIFPANGREESDRAQRLKSAELPPSYGYTAFQFNPSDYATRDRFVGVGAITVGLFDRKVVYISVSYSNTPQIDRTEQLMEIISRQFGLPESKTWPDYRDYGGYWNNPFLSCDGFTFQVFTGSGSILISMSDPTYKKIADERKRDVLARMLEEPKL